MKFLPQSTGEILRLLEQYPSSTPSRTPQRTPDDQYPKLSLEIFLASMEDCDFPLSRAESLSIGRLLIREKVEPKKIGSGQRGKDRMNRAEGGDTSILSQSVDLGMIENIRRGNYLSAAL